MLVQALRRLRSRPVASLTLVLALAFATSIPASLPIYAQAATARLLDEAVTAATAEQPTASSFVEDEDRPPFAYLFNYSEAADGPRGWQAINAVDDYLRTTGLLDLGLDIRHQSRMVDTVRFVTELPDGSRFGLRSLTELSDLDERARVVAGRRPVRPSDPQQIEVMVHRSTLQSEDIDLGVELALLDSSASADNRLRTIRAVVVGAWQASDESRGVGTDRDRWVVRPDLLEDRLFVASGTITDSLSPERPNVIRSVRWFALADGTGVTTDNVDDIVGRANEVSRQADALLPGTVRSLDPITDLRAFRSRVADLTGRLTGFSLPLVSLALAFVFLAVSVVNATRRNELAVLHSRGASRRHLLAGIGVEGVLIAVAGLLLGLVLARFIASLLSRTRSFLAFDGPGLDVSISRQAVAVAAAIAVGAVLAQVIPSWRAAGTNVVALASTRGRQRPWFQRTGVDIIVVGAVGLLAWTLTRRSDSSVETTDPLADPVIVLLPALLSLAAGLVTLRLLPLVARSLASALQRTDAVAPLVAFRRLARTPGGAAVPVLLLVLTVSLGTFTASMARTLDLQLFDEAHHTVGADESITEIGAQIRPVAVGFAEATTSSQATDAGAALSSRTWERAWGVDAASRVGRWSGTVAGPQNRQGAVDVIGIEPAHFADVAFWREDFAQTPLPLLMQRMGQTPTAALLSTSAQAILGVDVGDIFEADVLIRNESVSSRLVVAGTVEQFPTWRPATDDPLVIVDIDHLFRLRGESSGFRTWLRLDPERDDSVQREADILNLGAQILGSERPTVQIQRTIENPNRQGVFGLLSVGFVGSTVLSITGFFLYAVATFRSRLAEMGVLRALGLRFRSMVTLVVLDVGLLILASAAVGLGTGIAVSRWFIPLLLDVDAARAPIFLAEVDMLAAGYIALSLLALFAVVCVALIALLRRLEVFEAIKLGESV